MSIEMKAFIASLSDGMLGIALTFRKGRCQRRCGIPDACLRVETCMLIASTGAWPRGGVRPHHGSEKDREEIQERQALMIDSTGLRCGAFIFFSSSLSSVV